MSICLAIDMDPVVVRDAADVAHHATIFARNQGAQNTTTVCKDPLELSRFISCQRLAQQSTDRLKILSFGLANLES